MTEFTFPVANLRVYAVHLVRGLIVGSLISLSLNHEIIGKFFVSFSLLSGVLQTITNSSCQQWLNLTIDDGLRAEVRHRLRRFAADGRNRMFRQFVFGVTASFMLSICSALVMHDNPWVQLIVTLAGFVCVSVTGSYLTSAIREYKSIQDQSAKLKSDAFESKRKDALLRTIQSDAG